MRFWAFIWFLGLSLALLLRIEVAEAQEPTPTSTPRPLVTPRPVTDPYWGECGPVPDWWGMATPSPRWFAICGHCRQVWPTPELRFFPTPTPHPWLATQTPFWFPTPTPPTGTPEPTPTRTPTVTPTPPSYVGATGRVEVGNGSGVAFLEVQGRAGRSFFLSVSGPNSNQNQELWDSFFMAQGWTDVSTDWGGKSIVWVWNDTGGVVTYTLAYEIESFCDERCGHAGIDVFQCETTSDARGLICYSGGRLLSEGVADGASLSGSLVFTRTAGSGFAVECGSSGGLFGRGSGYCRFRINVGDELIEPTPTPTPTPVSYLPTPTPEPTPDPGSGGIDCSDLDPGEDVEIVPVPRVGDRFCAGIGPVNVTIPLVGEISIPEFRICFVPIWFGSVDLFGIRVNLDAVFFIMGAALLVRWFLRS